MLCPVCKTECYEKSICTECGFSDINVVFVNKIEADEWLKFIVKPYREKYWSTLKHFTFEGTTLKKYNTPNDKYRNKITVPYGIEIVAQDAFENAIFISEILMPSSVIEIEDYAFLGCERLHEILLPDSISKMGINIFSNCINLQTVKLPQYIEKIPEGIFNYCKALKNVQIPKNVHTIEGWAFDLCSNLEQIVLPRSIKNIKAFAFNGCKRLREVEFPEGLERIEVSAFSGANLEIVNLGQYVNYIEYDTFNRTVREINISDKNKTYFSKGTTIIEKKTGTVIFSADSIGADENHIKAIGEMAYASVGMENYSNVAFSHAHIPNSVGKIGRSAFFSCKQLEWICIPASTQNIDVMAFARCDNLKFIFCEAPYKPEGWKNGWDAKCDANILWGGEWEYIDGIPMSII